MLNKSNLIDAVAAAGEISKKKAGDVVEAFIATMKNPEGLMVVGEFSTEWVKVKAKKGRNPKTGEEIDIPAKTVLKIKSSKKLNK